MFLVSLKLALSQDAKASDRTRYAPVHCYAGWDDICADMVGLGGFGLRLNQRCSSSPIPFPTSKKYYKSQLKRVFRRVRRECRRITSLFVRVGSGGRIDGHLEEE